VILLHWHTWPAALLIVVFSASQYAHADEEKPSTMPVHQSLSYTLLPHVSEVDTTELSALDGMLSMERLIAHVVARNPSVAQATQALRRASERPAQAGALDDPMFSYMLGPGTLGSDQFDVAQKFEVSQSFPWPGKRWLRAEAARHGTESLRGDLGALREQLAYEARAAYIELWFLDRAIEINAGNRKLLEEFKQVAESKYASGIVPKQDALQARVEREMLVHDGQVLVRTRNRAAARINTLLNRPTDAALPAPPPTLPAPAPLRSLVELQAEADRNRPELASIASMIRVAGTEVSLASKEFYPDFSLTAGYDSFWGERELRPSVGFSVNLPIQVGRRRAAVREAKAKLAGEEAHAWKVRRDIQLEVHEVHEEVAESLDGIALYELHLLPAAEENIEAAQSGYAAGEVDFLALISAQKLLMDTTLQAKDFHAAYHMGVAKLDRAIGRSATDPALISE